MPVMKAWSPKVVLPFAFLAATALAADAVSGEFKTKGKVFLLRHAFTYTSESKITATGKETVEKTVHVILSDKPFDTAALASEPDPTRAIMRQAVAREASYLDLKLEADGKLKDLHWCPDYRTGLSWEGTPAATVAKLELNARDGKHLAGRLQATHAANPVDWAFDLRFDEKAGGQSWLVVLFLSVG